MLNIRLTVLSAVLGILPWIPILAQVAGKSQGTVLAKSDEPVLNAPYSAKRCFTSVTKLADGRMSRIESGGSEARDSQGRTYSAGERYWTYFDGKKNVLKSEMLYRIHDPAANSETKWDTTSKVVKVMRWAQGAPKEDAPITGCSCDEADNDTIEKLGMKNIEGFLVEGTRSSYTVPAGQDHNDNPIVVVHERWYCPELKIVLLETNNDPRSGATRNELINIVRGEPDIKQYLPPSDYVVREMYLPVVAPAESGDRASQQPSYGQSLLAPP